MWGGTTARERAQLRRAQALPTRAAQDRHDTRAAARRMHRQGRTKVDITRVLKVSGSTLNAYLTD